MMFQAWSFWLAWAIIVAGFVVLVNWNRRERRREHDEWLAERRLIQELRQERFRKMTDHDLW